MITAVSGIKAPAFKGNAEEVKENKSHSIRDISSDVTAFTNEATETITAISTGATDMIGAATTAAAPLAGVGLLLNKVKNWAFKTPVKDANGNKVVDFLNTKTEIAEVLQKGTKKLADLTEEELKQVKYVMKNSKVKIGLWIAAGVAGVGALIKIISGNNKEKKIEEAKKMDELKHQQELREIEQAKEIAAAQAAADAE